jgi:hypothetical protein
MAHIGVLFSNVIHSPIRSSVSMIQFSDPRDLQADGSLAAWSHENLAGRFIDRDVKGKRRRP